MQETEIIIRDIAWFKNMNAMNLNEDSCLFVRFIMHVATIVYSLLCYSYLFVRSILPMQLFTCGVHPHLCQRCLPVSFHFALCHNLCLPVSFILQYATVIYL